MSNPAANSAEAKAAFEKRKAELMHEYSGIVKPEAREAFRTKHKNDLRKDFNQPVEK